MIHTNRNFETYLRFCQIIEAKYITNKRKVPKREKSVNLILMNLKEEMIYDIFGNLSKRCVSLIAAKDLSEYVKKLNPLLEKWKEFKSAKGTTFLNISIKINPGKFTKT